jgi:inner membrane protein involved in colicin E2 resistance
MKKKFDQAGFLMLESLIAFAMFFALCTLLLPLLLDYKKELHIQEKRSYYYSLLQNELAKSSPNNQEIKEGDITISFRFTNEEGLKKGCMKITAKERNERRCLYGYLER